ncbi:IclR family transcriptional regulator [Marinimicrococcus flavescens]|uniref:IclR family transcriptional regulator n=1 Tax=Marinimicrococcus flavescens TaxID=3031815 RepID=A0AAP3XPU0_9PROT|nr:IclR family transcriptional regulator [Marinimicrococcus flavescens]
MDETESTGEPPGRRYSAPALEKGLDILELLAGERDVLPASEIAQRLGRSMGEIFRMLVTLEQRGWLRRGGGNGYGLSLRLFELAHRHPPVERLLVVALPEMQRLAERVGQSCHLSVHHDGRILVVAQAETPRPRGFVVRLGASFELLETASGRVLAAFQTDEERERRLARGFELEALADPGEPLRRRLAGIAARGHEAAPSESVAGILDLSFPLRDHTGRAVAALTLPFATMLGDTLDSAEATRLLGEAAARLSAQLGFREV